MASEVKRYRAVQEMRYFQHFEVFASSKAEAMRIAEGEQPGRRRLGRSKTRPAARPDITEEANSNG